MKKLWNLLEGSQTEPIIGTHTQNISWNFFQKITLSFIICFFTPQTTSSILHPKVHIWVNKAFFFIEMKYSLRVINTSFTFEAEFSTSGFSLNFRGSCEWTICMSYCERTKNKAWEVLNLKSLESGQDGQYIWKVGGYFEFKRVVFIWSKNKW